MAGPTMAPRIANNVMTDITITSAQRSPSQADRHHPDEPHSHHGRHARRRASERHQADTEECGRRCRPLIVVG